MLLYHEIIGATGAGCASTLVGHPLDTIKVHLQTNPNLGTSSQAAKYLLLESKSNPLVFFRGIGPPLINSIVMNTVMFSVFAQVKQAFPQDDNRFASALSAGLISGFATACLSTPTDYIKIQSQLQQQGTASSFDIFKSTLQTNPKALFRGHLANLGREGVFTMVYLGLYDIWKVKFTNTNQDEKSLMQVAAVSSLTGALAWVASYPFDTVKSVVQGSSKTITTRQAIQQLWNQGSFYKGCATSTGRAVLVTSIRMIAYEWILGLF